MESTEDIAWFGDSEERLLERALERELYGKYHGHQNLGLRFLQDINAKISEIAENLNLYSERNDKERVAPLNSGHVLIYKKEYSNDSGGTPHIQLLLIDVRKSY